MLRSALIKPCTAWVFWFWFKNSLYDSSKTYLHGVWKKYSNLVSKKVWQSWSKGLNFGFKKEVFKCILCDLCIQFEIANSKIFWIWYLRACSFEYGAYGNGLNTVVRQFVLSLILSGCRGIYFITYLNLSLIFHIQQITVQYRYE